MELYTTTPAILGAGSIPEVPNFLSLLHEYYTDSPVFTFLHHWENVAFSILISALVCIAFIVAARASALIPGPFQNAIELVIEAIEGLILGVLGVDGKRFVPFLGTLFVFVLSMNLFGLIPLMKSPSASINVTIALSLCVFVLVQYLNFRNMGLFGFLHHLAGSPKDKLGWAMAPLMFPIELITQISRPITLSLRLFGNILGEKILIAVSVLAGVSLLAPLHSPVGLPVHLPFMFLAILTSLMQALVFTLLSAVYILLSVPHEDEEHQT